jgi:succinate dehydrogenase hydrophobic anchor subunit
MNNDIIETIGSILTAILMIVLVALILGFPLMWLWNWLMPSIFNLPEITFWQALGLNALSTILIKPATNTKKD